jgi:hypothetical protein
MRVAASLQKLSHKPGLCCAGEIIAMQGLMNMIFEVQDLAVASPATVSRCGMVGGLPYVSQATGILTCKSSV